MQKEKKGYIHTDKCFSAYLKDQEFKQQETEWLDKICKHIVDIHGLLVIPQQTVIRLQELRNGTILLAGKKVKQYKNGVPFDLIYDAYQLASDSIKWCIVNKLNNDKSIKSINYGFAIMQGKINEAYQRKQRRKQQTSQLIKTVDAIDSMVDVAEKIKSVQLQPKLEEEAIDITTLLD